MNGKVGLIVLIFLTTIHGAENTEVIGSLQPIEAVIGGDVILPCHLEPPSDVKELTVEWKLNKSFVHVYRHRGYSPDIQDKRFENRTSLFHEEMTKGNISLKLSSVQPSDEGRYTCLVTKWRDKKGLVNLTVVLKVTEGNGTQERDVEKMSAGKIAGIVVAVAVVVVLLLVGAVVWAVKRRQSAQQAERSGVAVDSHEMENLAPQATDAGFRPQA
ncbi:myelin-oligodendrocyte glycoprotein-like isoform X1 [Centroberyx affinis]|uniref:myelin-oligodendrocyte glycoprotein-like isoform X1 n=1 Tax=Centroberyx affinis TaxID=166261 RepID=UPI003A5BF866